MKCGLFIIIVILVLGVFDWLVRPVWREWSNYDSSYGFYEQNDNTIETIFLGASTIANGIIPAELYRDYGICSYNMGTESQPLLASFYRAKEAYKYHSESLRTVVLDVSMLRRDPEIERYQKAIDGMKASLNKWEAIGAFTNSFQERLSYFVPLFEYHSRWEFLNKDDFEIAKLDINTFIRGFNYADARQINESDYKSIAVPEYVASECNEETILSEEALYYLKELTAFCKKHDIKLVLVKTPATDHWSIESHTAVMRIASKFELDFLDFCYDPLFSEICFNEATDMTDYMHANYYGAKKITSYIGKYLIEQCSNSDVRGNSSYSFMDEELKEFDKYVYEREKYNHVNSADAYLNVALENPDNVVFILAKDDASESLTEDMRKAFDDAGLQKLSEIGFRDSYIGIITHDGDVTELTKKNSVDANSSIEKQRNDLENITYQRKKEKNDCLKYDCKLGLTTMCSLKSGGLYLGDIASCVINNVEFSPNQRGLNMVVYDVKKNEVIDTKNYDTYLNSRQESDLVDEYNQDMQMNQDINQVSDRVAELYRYNRLAEVKKDSLEFGNEIEDKDLFDFLLHYKEKDEIMLFISSIGGCANIMNDDVRAFLKEYGFETLEDVRPNEPYAGIVVSGKVVNEKTAGYNEILELPGIICGDGTTSVKIDGKEYFMQGTGVSIIVYDTILNDVINSHVFNTNNISSIEIPENPDYNKGDK